MRFYAGFSWCLKGVWRCYCRFVLRFRQKETKGRFSCIAQVPGVVWGGEGDHILLPASTENLLYVMPSPRLHGRASTSEFCLCFWCHPGPLSPLLIRLSDTSPLSKCQACFNLRTYFFFLKCFPKISAALASSHFSEVTLQIQCHLLKETGNLSWSHPCHSLWVSFFIFIFHYLKYPFRCQVYLFSYCPSWSEI